MSTWQDVKLGRCKHKACLLNWCRQWHYQCGIREECALSGSKGSRKFEHWKICSLWFNRVDKQKNEIHTCIKVGSSCNKRSLLKSGANNDAGAQTHKWVILQENQNSDSSLITRSLTSRSTRAISQHLVLSTEGTSRMSISDSSVCPRKC